VKSPNCGNVTVAMPGHHLNYFFPYSGDVAHYETSLTRAFFALVGLSPLVHEHVIETIRQANQDLPRFIDLRPESSSLALEVSSIDRETGNALLVHLTGAPPETPASSTKTDAGRRYDAVLTYDCGWTVLFETKIGGADRKDATANIPHTLSERVVDIRWNDLIETIWRLIECGLLCGTEERVAQQFLEYVETEFESLCPYSTLGRCGGSPTRIKARCLQILRSFGPADRDRLDLGEGAIARFSCLVYNAEKRFLALCLWPGDTIRQAREFYTQAHVEGTLRLREGHQHWSIEPNLHLAFMQKNYVWTQVNLSLEDYLQLWVERMPHHGRTLARDEAKSGFVAAFNDLVSGMLASESDRPAFGEHFLATSRREMNICPGLAIVFEWPLAEAENLDRLGRFSGEVNARLREGLAAWGQTLPVEP
jgi:hypothetical protein